MQWKVDNFSEKMKNFLSKGKTIDDFKDFNDKNISPKEFINTLFYTLHPFEIKRYAKILSPTQKAITMVIYMHGGYASETDIVNFLNRHWNEITSVSKQDFARKPDSRLLHMNMSIRKKGLYIFVKNPDDSMMIGVNNANLNEFNDYVSDDSAQEEIKPMKSRSKRSAIDDAEANSDSSLADIDMSKEDNDDDEVRSSDFQVRSRRGGRMRGRQRSDSYSSTSSSNIRETRSKKDKKSNYGYSSDDKEKQSQDNNSSDYSSGNIKSSDYHYGRGMKRFTAEPIHQTPSLSSAAPVKSVGSSINMMKINSTLILPPVQKVPPPSYAIITSKPTEEEDSENKNKGFGTCLTTNWNWCNFSMTPAERILFFPLSKPLESSADSIQNDSKFDFNIPDHSSFEEIVVFVVDEACSRFSSFDSKCGITIDQIIEKVRDFKKNEGMFASLPVNRRVRAVLLEAKELDLVDSEFVGEKEIWFPTRLKKAKNSAMQNKFRISIPKPFANLKVKESNMTISQMYEKFTQDQAFGLKCTEFLP